MAVTDIDRNFLDNQQYTTPSILQYEQVFGEDFVSPGGIETARELLSTMSLQHGTTVLDAGCGLGGSCFLMAKEFGAKATGIDLSTNMLQIARDKRLKHDLVDEVELVLGDCSTAKYTSSFDAIYSRDVFLHIHDKCLLFESLFNALKSGGTLLFTDYCCGEKPWSNEFQCYVSDRRYCLHTVDEYARLIRAAGFEQVLAEDTSGKFIEILTSDLDTIAGLDIEEHEKNYLANSWKQKLDRAKSGHHRWGQFIAQKPA